MFTRAAKRPTHLLHYFHPPRAEFSEVGKCNTHQKPNIQLCSWTRKCHWK